MIENEVVVRNMHLIAELSDDEYVQLKVQATQANLTMKDWVSQAIREKLEKEETK